MRAARAAPSRPARTLVAACTPIAPIAANNYTTTTCPTVTVGRRSRHLHVDAARSTQQLRPHRLHRHHAGLAGLHDHDRPRRQPLVHRVHRARGSACSTRRRRWRPSSVRCSRRRRRSPPAPTATSGSPSARSTARARCSAASRRPA
jgi:hypothetical protein